MFIYIATTLPPQQTYRTHSPKLRLLLVINLILGERQDFEISKPEKGRKTVSRQNGHLINHCIPETIKFDFRVILLRRMKYL